MTGEEICDKRRNKTKDDAGNRREIIFTGIAPEEVDKLTLRNPEVLLEVLKGSKLSAAAPLIGGEIKASE